MRLSFDEWPMESSGSLPSEKARQPGSMMVPGFRHSQSFLFPVALETARGWLLSAAGAVT